MSRDGGVADMVIGDRSSGSDSGLRPSPEAPIADEMMSRSGFLEESRDKRETDFHQGQSLATGISTAELEPVAVTGSIKRQADRKSHPPTGTAIVATG